MKSLSRSAIGSALLIAAALPALSGAAFAQTPRRFLVPCSYPHGWNSTDASREVWGVPNGMDHQCIVEYYPDRRLLYGNSAY